MKLGHEILNHLEQLDYDRGGGITADSTRVDVINTPIMLIGLGGTGVTALLRAKKMINKRFRLPSNPDGTLCEKPDNIEFLAIDTDSAGRSLNYEGMTFSERNREFSIFENTKLESIYKNRDVTLGEDTKSWLSDNLDLQHVIHGAGAVRQAGRLLMFLNINNLINDINAKIDKITIGRPNTQSLYVFVIAGISGGTGSGIFLDIPYIVRSIAEDKGFSVKSIGMIFLPDVNLTRASTPSEQTNIKRNGFAALKELDYLMNLGRNNETFKQDYGGNLKINTKREPFDICHLISSLDSEGRTVLNSDYCMDVAGETIINFIASEPSNNGENYSLSSYLANITANRATFVAALSDKYPVNYIYNVVGASSTVLPLDDVVNYLTYKLFLEMEYLYKVMPNDNDVMTTASRLRVTYDILNQDIYSKIFYRDLGVFNYDGIRQNPNVINQVLQEDYMRLKQQVEDECKDIIERFNADLDREDNILKLMFKDLEQGPFFVSRVINSTNSFCLLQYIKNTRDTTLQADRTPNNVLSQLENDMINYRQKIIKGSFFGKAELVEDIKDSTLRFYQALLNNDVCDGLEHVYNAVYTALNNYNNNIFDTMTELLMKFKELFFKFSRIVSDGRLVTEGKETSFSWEIIDAPDLINEMNELMESNSDFAVNFKQVIQSFMEELISNSKKWTSTANVNLAGRVNEFLSKHFQNIVDKSMDYYLGQIATKEGKTLIDYINSKIKEMDTKAKVMFPTNALVAGKGIVFPRYSYLAVPENSPTVKKEASNILGERKNNIKESAMTNRMFMLNVNLAVPLVSYRELYKYENAYEVSVSANTAGLHLYESRKANWRDLPSPNYQQGYLDGHSNVREKERTANVHETFEKSLKYGFIKWDESEKKYAATYSEPFNIEAVLKLCDVDLTRDNIPVSAAQRAKNELQARFFHTDRKRDTIYLFDTKYMPNSTIPDDDYAKGVLVYMNDLYKLLDLEVKKYELVQETLEKLSEVTAGQVQYSQFAQIMYTGLIFKFRKNYNYTNSRNLDETIFTLTDMTDQYIEPRLYAAFTKLPQSEKDMLIKKATLKENNCSDEEFQAILAKIDSLSADYKEKSNQLRTSYNEIEDGENKADFYSLLINIFENSKRTLS